MTPFRRTSLVGATVIAVALSACGTTGETGSAAPGVSEPAATASVAPSPEPSRDPTSNATAEAEPSAALGSQERPTLGDPDAPVTLIEFSDFLCPYCQKFATDVEPEIVQRYVSTGKVRIVWHDFPARGEAAVDAAIAGRAAMRQDAFWEYHAQLFGRQGSSGMSRDDLVSIARDLGLDVEQFTTDLEDPVLERHVLEDLARGQRYGVRGTPSFLVGDQPVVGAQPLTAFTQAIEAQLADQG